MADSICVLVLHISIYDMIFEDDISDICIYVKYTRVKFEIKKKRNSDEYI